LALLSPRAGAQEGFRGYVFYSEGEDFVLSTDGRRQIYRAGDGAGAGFGLVPGDMIQTGADSQVELQIIPEGAVIKAAENTSFVFNGPGGDVETLELTLLYGRLRILTGTGGTRIRTLTGNAETVIVRGDIGIDFIIPPEYAGEAGSARPKLYVSAMSGAAEVGLSFSSRNSYTPDIPDLPVGKGETVSLELAGALSIIERKPLDPGVLSYWDRNNFRGNSPLLMPDSALFPEELSSLPAGPKEAPGDPAPPDFSAYKRLGTIKNLSLLAGAILTLAGTGFEAAGISSLAQGDTGAAHSRLITGTIPLGLGLFSLVFSLLVNPVLP
jgi:hypothetical protein